MDKPKQGKFFREFRGEIMNFKVDYDNEVKKGTSARIAGVTS